MDDDTLKSYLSEALSSGEDIIFPKDEIPEITDRLFAIIATSRGALHVKLAILILHLDVGWYTGRHSWTFRSMVRDRKTVDGGRFKDQGYLFPELFNNEALRADERAAIQAKRQREFQTIYRTIEAGEDPKGILTGHLCFGEDWVCIEGFSCPTKELLIPMLHESEVSAVCVPYVEALDLFNSEDPIYPGTEDQEIPENIVEDVRTRFSGELKMREYHQGPDLE